MKKKLYHYPHRLNPGFLLRLGAPLMLCLLVSSSGAWAQELQARANVNQPVIQTDKRISLRLDNQRLGIILERIEQESACVFIYANDEVDIEANVSLHVTDQPLPQVLETLLTPLRIMYQLHNDKVILVPKKVSSEPARQKQSYVIPPTSLLNLPTYLTTHSATKALTITGKVTSQEDNLGLPGVNVLVKGTTAGTTTNVDGDYTLNAPDGNGTLVFSYIGYTTAEVPINNRSTINTVMLPDIQSLQEVVVVGYGTQKKETATGAIASIKGTEIIQSPATNVTNSLGGRLPGVVTVTRSGEPGNDGSTIRIRGVNTLNNNDPLVVVDGIPGRSLERLDPNSIETITVLKDASAAIYGAQAANGVILVTTKRGKTGKPQITINLNQGFGRPTRIPSLANAPEYATMINEIDLYKGLTPRFTQEEIQKFSDGSDPWRYPNTDWFGEVLRPWSGQNYGNIQVSGGGENLRYFLLLGAKSQDGYYKNSATKYSQYDFRSNLDGNLGKHVNIGFDVAGRQEDRNFPTRSAGSIFRMVMRGKPNLPAYWPDGTPGPDIEYGDNPVVVSTDATGYDRDKWYVLQTNLKLNINIPWVKGLSINSNAGIDKGFRFHKRFETPWYLYSWDYQTYDTNGQPVLTKGKKGFDDPRLLEEMEDNLNILLNTRVEYERTIAEAHAIKVMVGTERRSGQGDRFNAFRRFFVSTAVDQLFAGGEAQMNNSGSAYQNARLNYFGRVNYNYLEKYLVEFVWRYDGSYIFPQSKRYGFFPGVSAGWRISEENFWKNSIGFIDNFKLRGSWGQTGNDRIAEYQYLATYAYGRFDATGNYADRTLFQNEAYIFALDQENKALYEALIPNPNVTWEVANQSNIGFETQFLNSKFSIEADYFRNTRSQILWRRNASIPGSTGLTLPPENIGKVVNNGFDFNLGYGSNVGDFSYQVSVNGGYQRNKITFWDESPGRPEYQRSTGNPIPTDPFNPDNDLYYQAIGVFNDEAEVAANPHWTGARAGDIIFKDVNGDGAIDANDRVRNDRTNIPRFTGGFSINMQFKGFDLAVLFQGASGAVQYISTESGEIGNFLKDFYDNRWTAENPDASGPRTFNRTNEYWMNNRNTYFLHKTDYLRLKNIQLGYNLPVSLTNKIGMQNIRFYVSGLNLFTYSPDFRDFDPETDNSAGTAYPLQKVVNGGMTITF